jgi:hypothetical protein
MTDDDLKALFEELRSDDARSAPSFAATRGPRRTRRPLAWALVPAAVATALVVVLVWSMRRADASPIRVGLRDPEPLAFLLEPVHLEANP